MCCTRFFARRVYLSEFASRAEERYSPLIAEILVGPKYRYVVALAVSKTYPSFNLT